MKRRNLLVLGLSAVAATAAPALEAGALPVVEVFRNPSCGCCGAWAEHLQAAGFDVKITAVEDTSVVRKRHGLPDRLRSCHTAVVAGYVVEGHVPANDIKKLLAMRPLAIGLAVPGMPAGSPGMEAGSRRDRYQVLLVDKQGREQVFAAHG